MLQLRKHAACLMKVYTLSNLIANHVVCIAACKAGRSTKPVLRCRGLPPGALVTIVPTFKLPYINQKEPQPPLKRNLSVAGWEAYETAQHSLPAYAAELHTGRGPDVAAAALSQL